MKENIIKVLENNFRLTEALLDELCDLGHKDISLDKIINAINYEKKEEMVLCSSCGMCYGN